ncbi:hypothetical protein ASD31_02970 [Rhizobium sp. Root482]|nr:hypothetical protein ASD31_02970 [Rhizobium sp. Root482]
MNAPDPRNLTAAAGCQIGIINSGVVPAKIHNIEAQGFTDDFPLPANHNLPDKWTTLGTNIILHVGLPSDFVIQAASVSVTDYAAVIASTSKRLYYVARVTYEDTIGSGYAEQICFSVNFGQGHPRFEGANKHNDSK